MGKGLFWRSRCPHSHLSGIYGDAINVLNTRLICLRCGRSIDGPVVLATLRNGERELLATSLSQDVGTD